MQDASRWVRRAARPEGRQARRGPEVGQVPMRRHRAVGCIAPVTQRCVVGACCVLASRGRVCNPFAMPDAEPQLLTLDIPGIGSLTVIWAPEDRSWFWTVYTAQGRICLLYTSPSPRDGLLSRMP